LKLVSSTWTRAANRLAAQHAALQKAADDAPLVFAHAVVLVGGIFGQVRVKRLLRVRFDRQCSSVFRSR